MLLCTAPTPSGRNFDGAARLEIAKAHDFTILREARRSYTKVEHIPANRSGGVGELFEKRGITARSRFLPCRTDRLSKTRAQSRASASRAKFSSINGKEMSK